MIQVICSHCGLRILVPPTVQGKRGSCFNCGQALVVPGATDIKKHANLDYERGDRVTDRYVIREFVGKGGMGVVYKAQDTLVDETVALKFLHPKLLSTEKGQRFFIQEAQIARRLRHENIVAVHDVSWTVEGILFLSMEYVEGQSLRDFLRGHRKERRYISIRLAVAFTSQILRALEYAHRSVIHRDIKPENVMVLTGERIKVLDFGLAKAVQEEVLQEASESTESKKVIGTLAYAAPEQVKKLTMDARADIYAVGLILRELLTLRTPIEEQVPVERAREDVAPSLLSVLEKAMMPERERRFATARDFRRALNKAFDESYRRQTEAITVATRSDNATSTEGMVFLDGGSFLMGSNNSEVEAPEEEVTVAPFWMDVYPVTVAQFSEYLQATGAAEPKFWRDPMYNGPQQPVVGVSWMEAAAYAAWAGKELPSEMQWEFAARGRENRLYPWGNHGPDSTVANYNDFLGMPSIVTMHEEGATPDGIFDLAGNMYEWTADPFVPYQKQRTNPKGAAEAPRRSLRGGSWSSPPNELQSTFRKGLFPEAQVPTVGFRCVINTEAT